MKIAFTHNNKAFLPEIEAYKHFFHIHGIECISTLPEKLTLIDRDIEWFFMGSDFSKRQHGIYRIHEYSSPSVPPIRKIKNLLKKTFATKPDLRIFLNTYVRETMNFRDDIPFCMRDMGIRNNWLEKEATSDKKNYDFIYIGDLSGRRNTSMLLNVFTREEMRNYSLLILSKDYDHLKQAYRLYSNIQFKGPVPNIEVDNYIASARFAINYIPDVEPFNQLTSTKFLEYAACGTPIISSDYSWVRKFQQGYGGNYFYLSPDLSNLTWDNINNFRYSSPDLSSWTWEQQIRKSGVLEFLQSRFAELRF